MRFHEILTEGEVVAFKPPKRLRRHLVDVFKVAKPGHPWAVFVHGQYYNCFRTEEQAQKVAADKEKEFDRFYEETGIRLQIMSYGNEYVLLDRGVSIGVFSTPEAAEAKAEEIDPGSTRRMIRAWYRGL